ncbi:MAG: hypothetical protein WA020_07760 [Candidatus Acidiferrales bacterium]
MAGRVLGPLVADRALWAAVALSGAAASLSAAQLDAGSWVATSGEAPHSMVEADSTEAVVGSTVEAGSTEADTGNLRPQLETRRSAGCAAGRFVFHAGSS